MKNYIPIIWFVLFSQIGCIQTIKQKNIPQTDSIYQYKNSGRDGIGKIYQGREISYVMDAAGANWLERNDRNEEENTTLSINNLPINHKSVVADIGAGSGYYTFRIAQKVPEGKVYAIEIQDDFIKLLKKNKQEREVKNVEIIKGTEQNPNLPANSIDLAILVDVYHELAYPQEMLSALAKALKPSGKILLLEYRAEDPNIAIKELHKMSVKQVNKEMAANGFKLYKREEFLPIQHFLLYEKAK
ncbi:MAG: class I SAM-dependent methyltransferase [Bacteroidetes bacterium]|nr:class I SAM-dependent methyltransferase [Bacteroidota bacterium]MBU1371940.1 class I SAM-dependent methyltransferase [Bacteroidota bacterium]MBU1483542.1 class I SAM-dependent methyltransferase [Bacteroidota bacterium]MBU1761226.1 class I SAM-dependent methyltransferase [Bacteroidota bacterium]MBU2045832.1 class I SAM-dependent methyltransferase [Bacteroidota bacterium]